MISQASIGKELEYYRTLRKGLRQKLGGLPRGAIYFKTIRGHKRPYVYRDGKEHYLSQREMDQILGLLDRKEIEECIRRIEQNEALLRSIRRNIFDLDALMPRIIAHTEGVGSGGSEDGGGRRGAGSEEGSDVVVGTGGSGRGAGSDVVVRAGGSGSENGGGAACDIPPGKGKRTTALYIDDLSNRRRRRHRNKQHITSDGIEVRSRAELILYEYFKSLGLDFEYERPLFVDGVTLHPDFTLIRRKDGKKILWEHCGMMDKESYVQDYMQRQVKYAEAGYFPFENLIYTYDFGDDNIDMLQIDRLLRMMELI